MRLHPGEVEAAGWRVETLSTLCSNCARQHPTSPDVRG